MPDVYDEIGRRDGKRLQRILLQYLSRSAITERYVGSLAVNMGNGRLTGKIDADYKARILLQHVSRSAITESGRVPSLAPDIGTER